MSTLSSTMPIEYERKFLIAPVARDTALAHFAGAPTARILDAYLPPRGGAGPRLRLRVEAPVGEPDPPRAVACVKVPRPDGKGRDELEWEVPLPQPLPAGAGIVAKLRATIADLSPQGATCTVDAYTSPATAACPLTGAPLSGPVLGAEVEGDPAAVDAWVPPPGWIEVTGRPEFGAGHVAEHGWPAPPAS